MRDFKFVDLHGHHFMKAYAHSFKEHGPTYKNSDNHQHKNSSWWSDRPTGKDLHRQVHGLLGLTKFTQCDIRACINGNLGVIFSTLYPLEKGFTYPLNCTGDLADKLLNEITMFGKPRIDFVQEISNGPEEGYWIDLQQEYAFQRAQSGKVKTILGNSYCYHFVNDYRELEQVLASDKDGVRNLAVINSIEGAHCFGSGIKPYDLELPERLAKILERVRVVKEDWDHPPFFITLGHHFYNEICGHAKSLGTAGLVLNQKHKMNTGLTPAGRKVIELLLDETVGRRVLIDMKHMSLRSRKEYYRLVADQYDYSVPIIASHGCVTGRHDRIDRKKIPSNVAGDPHRKFSGSDINFYDFEIIEIKRSGGIFGIQFDESRIASGREKRKSKRVDPRLRPKASARLVWNQLQHIAEVLDDAGFFAWDIQAIGSDYDGIINPIDGFFTVEYYDNLKQLLLLHAEEYAKNEMQRRIKQDRNRIKPEEIIYRFCYQNGMDFLRKHFWEKGSLGDEELDALALT